MSKSRWPSNAILKIELSNYFSQQSYFIFLYVISCYRPSWSLLASLSSYKGMALCFSKCFELSYRSWYGKRQTVQPTLSYYSPLVGIRDALAKRTAVIRTLMHTLLKLEIRMIFNRRLLKMVVISTVTMIWIIWLLLMIQINTSYIRKQLNVFFQEDASCVSFL